MKIEPRGEHGLEHFQCSCGFTAQMIHGGAILPGFDEVRGRLHEAALDRSLDLLDNALKNYGIE